MNEGDVPPELPLPGSTRVAVQSERAALLVPPIAAVRCLAMLRAGIDISQVGLYKGADIDEIERIWPRDKIDLHKVGPLFQGRAPYSDHPYAYLFADAGETDNPGVLAPSDNDANCAEWLSMLKSARATPSDFTAWVENMLKETSADMIDQDLPDLLSKLNVFMRSMQATNPNIFFTVTKGDGRGVVYVSEWIEKLTGYAPNEFMGRDCRFLQGCNTDDWARRKIRKVALEAPHEPVEVVILNYRKDGTPFWNLLSILPIMDDVGQPKVFLGTQVDVSDIVDLIYDSDPTSPDEIVAESRQGRFNALFHINSLRHRRRPKGRAYAPLHNRNHHEN